ncbi:hypothetical protein DYH09_00875 [bacterium CPR1]|nr:hypothetical protein [bacterium CPR1]
MNKIEKTPTTNRTNDEAIAIAMVQFDEEVEATKARIQADIKHLTLQIMKCHNDMDNCKRAEQAVRKALEEQDHDALEDLLGRFFIGDLF